MKEIKPIQTYYDGHWFRSRLEARWAVVFNVLGVPYEYEPEGFDLGNGLAYLPDFRVKCHGTRGDYEGKPFDLYIEVKGKMNKEDAEKIRKFCGLQSNIKYICGFDAEHPSECVFTKRGGTVFGNGCTWGGKTADSFTKCEFLLWGYEQVCINTPLLVVNMIPNEGCATDVDLWQYEMDGTDIYPFNYETIDGDNFGAYPAATSDGKFYLFGADSSYINHDDEIRMEKAYRIARCARFEHGERPPV